MANVPSSKRVTKVISEPMPINRFKIGGPDLAVPAQAAIAVHRDEHGAILIIQEPSKYDEDITIIVLPEHVEALIARLRTVAAGG